MKMKRILLIYLLFSTSSAYVDRFTVIIPADPTKPIVDHEGNVLATTVPSALHNARTAFLNELDMRIDAAAAAGKFAR